MSKATWRIEMEECKICHHLAPKQSNHIKRWHPEVLEDEK